MSEVIGIQAATIAQLQMEIEKLQAENKKLDKRSKDIYVEYQKLFFDLQGMPTPVEIVKLKLDLLHANQKLKAIEEWSKG